MDVVTFDIDGTLVASADFDGELYAEAIRDVLGVDIDKDWSRYENVTDSGILEQILAKHSPTDQQVRLAQEVHANFVGRAERYVAKNPGLVREVPGALALVEALRKSSGVRVCLATGGWAETAGKEPLNNSARARRRLCGRLRLGLGERGLVVPNKRVQTRRRPRKGPSRRVSPEKPHLARCDPRP